MVHEFLDRKITVRMFYVKHFAEENVEQNRVEDSPARNGLEALRLRTRTHAWSPSSRLCSQHKAGARRRQKARLPA